MLLSIRNASLGIFNSHMQEISIEVYHYTGWAKKRGHRLLTTILSNFNRFTFFFTERFLSKFAAKWILNISPHLAHVAKLPCETLMSAKQAINDKLQGSAHIWGVVGLLITKLRKGLLLSVWVKKKFKSVNTWQSYKQERGCLMHFARLANTLLKREEMCGLQTRPRTDVDPPRFLPQSKCRRCGAYRLAAHDTIPC